MITPLYSWPSSLASGRAFAPLKTATFSGQVALEIKQRTVGIAGDKYTRFTALCPVSRYQKGKTNLDFTEARDSEWQWHQLGHMQICTSLQTNNHASTPPLHISRPDVVKGD